MGCAKNGCKNGQNGTMRQVLESQGLLKSLKPGFSETPEMWKEPCFFAADFYLFR
jgi:hypothetical protein